MLYFFYFHVPPKPAAYRNNENQKLYLFTANQSSKQPILTFRFTLLYSPVLLKKTQSCLLFDSVKVKVYLHTDTWEHIDLINSVCEEYHKMMRTS